ncbi:hypothetical protein OESDEN_20665 [Oesophagostomum dentatum]|uniref:Uncharacterized protein n=1 Tax=Oesophagostomum dentatum TaxID=61180 RepID=A0A0B1S735_OESDE|nr:hypothetical protein OESDEN_20665 [Oesophagostomum dentatum]
MRPNFTRNRQKAQTFAGKSRQEQQLGEGLLLRRVTIRFFQLSNL